MSDEPERQDLEDRVDQLESTISKMLPGRRDALKLGGAALVGGAAMSGSASAGTSQAGTIGTANDPVDVESEDINNADTVTTQDLVVNGTATGVNQGLQGCRVFLSTPQNLSETAKIEFDSVEYDSDSNFNTNTHNFVCPSTGIYYAKAKANFESGSVGDFRQLAIGNGSNFAPFGEGSRLIDNNSSPNDEVEVATMNKYASGDTISAYATNLNSSDSLEPGRGNFGTHLEVVFLGSL